MLERLVRGWDTVNARERVRLAIRQRLEALGMTQREFGRRFSANDGKGHVDTWVSSLLAGQFALSLDELDEAARILKVSPCALIKSDVETAEYLTPTEARIVTAVRALPPPIRDHVKTLAEYLLGVAPEEVTHLMEFRKLEPQDQEKVQHWTHALVLAQVPVPTPPIQSGQPATNARPTDAESRNRKKNQK